MKITVTRSGKVACELTLAKLRGKDWEIKYLLTDPKHRGEKLAARALARAEHLADRRGWRLIGLVDPDRTGLTKDQIVGWLKRHGFAHDWYAFGPNWRKRVLIRTPRPSGDSARFV
jgi:GNAT superfamily N-acetyltransferase